MTFKEWRDRMLSEDAEFKHLSYDIKREGYQLHKSFDQKKPEKMKEGTS